MHRVGDLVSPNPAEALGEQSVEVLKRLMAASTTDGSGSLRTASPNFGVNMRPEASLRTASPNRIVDYPVSRIPDSSMRTASPNIPPPQGSVNDFASSRFPSVSPGGASALGMLLQQGRSLSPNNYPSAPPYAKQAPPVYWQQDAVPSAAYVGRTSPPIPTDLIGGGMLTNYEGRYVGRVSPPTESTLAGPSNKSIPLGTEAANSDALAAALAGFGGRPIDTCRPAEIPQNLPTEVVGPGDNSARYRARVMVQHYMAAQQMNASLQQQLSESKEVLQKQKDIKDEEFKAITRRLQAAEMENKNLLDNALHITTQSADVSSSTRERSLEQENVSLRAHIQGIEQENNRLRNLQIEINEGAYGGLADQTLRSQNEALRVKLRQKKENIASLEQMLRLHMSIRK